MMRNRSEDLLRVGLYDLGRTLGKGNFSLVRLGVHRLSGVEVAVKIMSKSCLDPENASKIQREMEIMRSLLPHPHIIRLFQVMQSDTALYMVTEHAQKGEIFDYIAENGRLTEKKASQWFGQIVSALGYLHSVGIVHRDLKAENLLLDEKMNVKLADFGFANYYNSEGLLSTWCGSPPYAAPELFEGKAYVGPKADVWSLGVVLYVLVSGSLPFDAPTLQELKLRVLSCQYRVPFFLSNDCEALLKGLLVLEPEKRFSLKQIGSHPWMIRNEVQSGNVGASPQNGISDGIVDAVAKAVKVPKYTVVESITRKKCDDIAATYHLTEMSLSHSCVSLEPQESGVLEIYGDEEPPALNFSKAELEKALASRRHTVGPGHDDNTRHLQLPSNLMKGSPPILPQTDLTLNLPLVGDQPLENFSIKNPHLLRPPAGLDSFYVNHGRRASDGGAYLVPPPASILSSREEGETTLGGTAQLLSPKVIPPELASPRRRRSGGLQPVIEKHPETNNCNSDLTQESENRILDSGGWLSVGSIDSASPNKSSSMCSHRHRRTGLSTVMETGKKDSLSLPYERFSPVRRSCCESSSSSSTSPCSTIGGFNNRSSVSLSPDPSDIRALQEEYHNLQVNLGKPCIPPGITIKPSSPVPPDYASPSSSMYYTSNTLDIPRRSSDGGVVSPKLTLKIPASRSAGNSEPLKLMYDDMYTAVDASLSRRFSYPNSPVHFGSGSTSPRAGGSPLPGSSPKPMASPNTLKRQSFTRNFQGLTINKIETQACNGPETTKVFKGSITQGLPSRNVPSTEIRTQVPVPSTYTTIPTTTTTIFTNTNDSNLVSRPEICVTDVTGFKVNPVYHEPMEEGL